MTHNKFNENTNYYPIVLIPFELSDFLNNEISSSEILTYLNYEIPILDLKIKKKITRIFYDKNFDNTITDNTEAIKKFKDQFPNYKITNNNYFTKTYSAEYYVNENIFFDSTNNYGDYYIGKHILPDKPLDYYEITEVSKNWGCVFQYLILASFFLSLIYTINLIFFFLSSLIILFVIFRIFPNMNTSETKRVKKDSMNYNKELTNYKSRIEKIKEKIITDFNKEFLLATKFAEDKRQIIEPKIFLDKLKPKIQTIQVSNNNYKGKSETLFLSKLCDVFNTQVHVNKTPNIGENPFQPDFIIICDETKFHIDIEIDEPYSTINGIPIHHNLSNDDDRDLYFLDLNWGVIRFSEKQIIENVNECIDLIKNVLYSIRKKKNTYKHNIPLTKKWSYEEALKMSKDNYRNTYLPNNLKVEIIFNDDDLDDLPF